MELTVYQEKVLELLNKKQKNMTFKQIKRDLHINTETELEILINDIKDLEANGYLYLNDYDEYMLFSKIHDLAIGEVRCNSKEKAYVVVGSNNIFIPSSHLNGAIAGDIVIVKLKNYKADGNSRGTIDKILKRNKGEIIFDYIDGNLIPYNWPFPVNVNIPSKQLENIVNGSRIVVKVSLEMEQDSFLGEVISCIGHKDDPSLDIKTMAMKNGIFLDFPEDAMEQVKNISDYVSEEEVQARISKGGLDLRKERIYTMDGKNTKDIDDAFNIEKLPNGHYKLGVHIADVSYYVPEDSPLDLAARQKSTSCYPYNYVFPMLPHELSNGICSLNPNVDRLALSILMEFDEKGKLIDFEIVDTIINSKKKMVYEEVNEIFEKGKHLPEYDPYIYDLAVALELSELLNKQKQARGYLFFGDHDVSFTDEQGIAVDVHANNRGLAQKMIENFMLMANECAASFYYWLEIPGIYRNHPIPDVQNLKNMLELLNLNIKVPNNIDNPRIIQNILSQVQKKDQANIYSELLLQTMKRAYYSPTNIGHFGLALDCYTHFTSPIRRYPDLQTHRVIRQVRDDILNIDFEKEQRKISDMCKYASLKERLAEKTEQEVDFYKMAEYMEQHIGETFTVYISYIGKRGISVKTDSLITGKISMDILKSKGFYYNNQKLCLHNKNSKETLSLGDSIEVKLIDASKETGKIEFTLKEAKPKKKVIKKVS